MVLGDLLVGIMAQGTSITVIIVVVFFIYFIK